MSAAVFDLAMDLRQVDQYVWVHTPSFTHFLVGMHFPHNRVFSQS